MSQDRPLITGLVAQIVSEREIAINVGSKQGVEIGMRFAVLAATPQEVRDPETDEVLDTIDREKVRVEATEVRERITICATYRTKHIPGGPYSITGVPGLAGLFAPSRDVAETLRVEDSSLPSPIEPDESFVKRGDRVVELRALPGDK